MGMNEKKINIIASCCIRDNGKVLFVQENKSDIKNLWDLPGGKVQVNENIKEAAIREIYEETGYNVELEDILLMQNIVNERGVMVIVYFNAKLVDKEQREYRKNEISNVKWYDIDELKSMDRSEFRGNSSYNKIIHNIENNISYPISMLDIC